ncbi:MAG: DUF1552 domain-containing protein [Myxococcales bacterium]|nr:DUF1552 domain-containing protein [Myxococcales bacterium]MCB9629832.1 DUF1552 domain-containing protein [Sandaracinaceae bacterium]
MAKRTLTRRTVLKGLLGGATVTLGLPMFDLFCNDNGTALADGQAFPKRFGVWFWGNGVIPDRWAPTDLDPRTVLPGEPAWVPSRQLELLTPVQRDVTVITGANIMSNVREPHIDGTTSFLSGVPLGSSRDAVSSAPTIDAVAANAIGSTSPFPALRVKVEPGGGRPVSWNGLDQVNTPVSDPYELYRSVFFDGGYRPNQPPTIDPRWQLQESALSAVGDELAALRSQLGAHDRHRLAEHETHVRELELLLLRRREAPAVLEACDYPDEPSRDYPTVDSRVQMQERHRALARVLAMALACDRTRVVHTVFTAEGSEIRFPGIADGHHNLSHKVSADAQALLVDASRYIVGEYAFFVEQLASIQEGDCRLIDNMALLGTSGCSLGATHGLENHPILVAGAAGGRLVPGRHVRTVGANASKVAFSLLRAVGAGVSAYGAAEAHVVDGLSEMEA